MNTTEEFRRIKGYSRYEVSEFGKVRSYLKSDSSVFRLLKPQLTIHGYLSVTLSKNGKCFRTRVHRLVAEHFCENPHNQNVVRHLDGNKENNHFSNLSWGTYRDNYEDSRKHGTNPHGENHGRARLTREQVLEIRRDYWFVKGKSNAADLTKKYNVSRRTITYIVSGSFWKLNAELEAIE